MCSKAIAHYRLIYEACKNGDINAFTSLFNDLQYEKSEAVVSHALLVAVQHQRIEMIQHIFATFKVDEVYVHLYEACRCGNISLIKYLMQKCKYPHINWNFMAESACKGGHKHILDYVNTVKPRGYDLDKDLIFHTLCAYGHFELAKHVVEINNQALILMPRAYTPLNYYTALCTACENGHLEVAKFITETQTLTKCNIEDAILHAKLGQQYDVAEYLTSIV